MSWSDIPPPCVSDDDDVEDEIVQDDSWAVADAYFKDKGTASAPADDGDLNDQVWYHSKWAHSMTS